METSVLVLRITRNLKTWVAIRAITLPNYNEVVINYSTLRTPPTTISINVGRRKTPNAQDQVI